MNKFNVLGAITSLLITSQLAMAGGDATMQAATFNPHAYLEGMAGYAQTGWEDITGTDYETISFDYTKNKNGGFSWGGAIGYQWLSWMAIEAGAFKLPTTDLSLELNSDNAPSINFNGSIKGTIYYLAGKMSHPIKDKMNLFAKAGLNYQDTSVSDDLSYGSDGIKSNDHIGPFFGVGASYSIKSNWYAKIEYDRASGQADHQSDEYAPNPNIIVAGLGYSFG